MNAPALAARARRISLPALSPLAQELVALAAVVTVVMLVVSPIALAGRLPRGVDTSAAAIPFATFLHDRLAHGDLPFWAPGAFSGQPFAADAQSGVFYPPTLLASWLLAPLAALRAVATVHYLLAALATYGFARSLRASRGGSAVAALAYALSGHLIARGIELGMLGGAAWLPVVLLAAEGAARGGSRRVPLLGLALAGSLLEGSQQLSVVCVIASAAWMALRGGRRGAGWSIAATALGCGLAAFALLPRFELLRLSTASGGYADPATIGKLVLGDSQAIAGLSGVGRSEVATLYLGAAAPALACIALVRRGAHALPLVVLAAISLAWASGLAGALLRPLPLVGSVGAHEPVRGIILALLAVAVLAGLALDHLPRPHVLLPIGAALGFASAGLTGLRPAFTLPLALVSLACLAPRRIALPLILLAFAGDLAWQATHQQRRIHYGDAAALTPAPTPGARFLLQRQRAGAPFRVAAFAPSRLTRHQLGGAGSPLARTLLFDQEAMRVGLEDVAGYNPEHLATYHELIRRSNGGAAIDRHFEYITRAATPELRALSVRYYVSPTGLQPAGLGVVYRDRVIVITEDRAALPFASVRRGEAAPVRADVLLREPDRIVVAAPQGGGTLVLASPVYPGWHVSVDGSAARASAVGGLLAVRLPAAGGAVEWRFEPTGLRLGLALSALAVIVSALLALAPRRLLERAWR